MGGLKKFGVGEILEAEKAEDEKDEKSSESD